MRNPIAVKWQDERPTTPSLLGNDSPELFYRSVARIVIYHNGTQIRDFGNLRGNGIKTIDRQISGAIVYDNDPDAPSHLLKSSFG